MQGSISGLPAGAASAVLDRVLSGLVDRYSSQATATAGLVVGTVSNTTAKIGATAFAGVAKGVPVTIAADTAMPALSGDTQTAGYFNIYCFFIDADSVVTVAQGDRRQRSQALSGPRSRQTRLWSAISSSHTHHRSFQEQRHSVQQPRSTSVRSGRSTPPRSADLAQLSRRKHHHGQTHSRRGHHVRQQGDGGSRNHDHIQHDRRDALLHRGQGVQHGCRRRRGNPTTDGNTGAAFVPVGKSQGSVFVLAYDGQAAAANAIKVYQGSVEALTSDASGANAKFIGPGPTFPSIPNSVCAFAYLITKVGASGTAWTFGASNLAGPPSNVLHTFTDVFSLPDRPQV